MSRASMPQGSLTHEEERQLMVMAKALCQYWNESAGRDKYEYDDMSMTIVDDDGGLDFVHHVHDLAKAVQPYLCKQSMRKGE